MDGKKTDGFQRNIMSNHLNVLFKNLQVLQNIMFLDTESSVQNDQIVTHMPKHSSDVRSAKFDDSFLYR